MKPGNPKKMREGLLAVVLVILLSTAIGPAPALLAVFGIGCLYELWFRRPSRPPPLPRPPKATKVPPKIVNPITALDAVKNLSVEFYRRVAQERGCAPTATTSDQEIIEVIASVTTAFRQVAGERKERIAAPNVNFVVLMFLQVYEQMGRQMYEAHLRYEIENYRRYGLRQDYRQELSVVGAEAGIAKQVVVVGLVGGFNGGQEIASQLFTPLIQDAIGSHQGLRLIEFTYIDELLVAGLRGRFNLLVVFLNPCFEFSSSVPVADQISDFEALRRLKSISGTPLIVLRSGAANLGVENLRQAGADAVFEIPFGVLEMRNAVRACLSQACDGQQSGVA